MIGSLRHLDSPSIVLPTSSVLFLRQSILKNAHLFIIASRTELDRANTEHSRSWQVAESDGQIFKSDVTLASGYAEIL